MWLRPWTNESCSKSSWYVFKGLNGSGPRYLTSSISVYTQSHYTLRSKVDAPRFSILKFKSIRGLISAFNKSFSLTTPTMWNLRSPLNSGQLHPFKVSKKIWKPIFTKYTRNVLLFQFADFWLCLPFIIFWFPSRRRDLYEMAPYKCNLCMYVCIYFTTEVTSLKQICRNKMN